ncbi:isoaspartyl peptidase/L-asparaginase isoform X2 [Paramormyrops kingsleyae]|uniref:Isoaspartyl peptidase/L-asparaginase n=1 Tax=Paramormyrops kingsleyae TaxID=1676925 RepID=A0A3B3RD49_9TELE|nr:isoaspartyl peptidase/L-asparaginase isoform X1 [Paramormyrops kingsleyae]
MFCPLDCDVGHIFPWHVDIELQAMPSLPVLVVHGGAGHIPKDRAQISCAGVREAARVGYACLQAGGSAMDAVTEAVTNLENNPAYNAGRGSVLTQHGTVEMDAIVMDGRTLASGAVSAVRRIANPVQLARLVMEKTSHLCLTAEGASHFARAMGVPEVPEESLITEYARMRWRKNLDPDANPVQCMMMGGETPSAPVDTHDTEGKIGTVGAVAVDAQGNIACATSTGGMLNKMEGRVGDTACIGCGAYADNHVGAVSPTGHGEAIMKVTLSRLILFYMEQGKSAQEAADQGLAYMKDRVQGLGGVVVVDPRGDWAARFTSAQMAWAAAQGDQLHYGLYVGEHFTQPITDPKGP